MSSDGVRRPSHDHGAGAARGEGASISDRVAVGSETGGDTRLGGLGARGWGLPITGTLKATECFNKKLRQDHGGRLTQAAAVAMATRDKNVQMKMQKLTTRAADVTWTWVAHMKQTGSKIGEVWRPELGILGTPMMLWELQEQATTGWNMDVRSLISNDTLEKVVLSRKVLESMHGVTERDRAEEHGVSVEDLHGMDLGPVMMTPQIAQKVWTNVNKLRGLKETGGPGSEEEVQ